MVHISGATDQDEKLGDMLQAGGRLAD